MERSQIVSILNQYKLNNSAKYGIKRLGIFGSTARHSATSQSDIDIVVELKKQDLFTLIGIKQDLEEQMGTKVDIVSYRKNMNLFLKQRIDQEAVYA